MSAAEARSAVTDWLTARSMEVGLGLPEYDDRLRVWRVALLAPHNGREPIGEVQVSNGSVVGSTEMSLVEERAESVAPQTRPRSLSTPISFTPTQSAVVLGDSAVVLAEMPAGSAQLVFTSPPYFNAKPECYEASTYRGYLDFLAEVFGLCHGVLSEGRFLVVNTSPVLVRRAHRQASSRRLPIPFDLHCVIQDLGFEFVDDIIWQKPEGAGWHLGRGRRFAADRQPLQYKPVTVTEYLMVYRKRTERLIDWNIRCHPDPDAVGASLVGDGYERTNIWQLSPHQSREHPAAFPFGLAERVVRYYSFKGDMVLDPFAGTGTTGQAAAELGRRFTLIDNAESYYDLMCSDMLLAGAAPRLDDMTYYGSTL